MKRLTREQIEDLLTRHHFEERPDLRSDAYDSTTYRLLDNGQLLYYRSEGAGTLMPSLQHFLQARKGMPVGEPRHILAGITPDREAFMAMIPGSASQIASALHLPLPALDASFASLHRIDAAIRSQHFSRADYEQKLFPWLIAYLGTVILHEKGGRWELHFDETANAWEPFIILPTGKTVNLFIDLYENAQEDYQNLSVFTISQLRLESL
jgi:hypothetical protein